MIAMVFLGLILTGVTTAHAQSLDSIKATLPEKVLEWTKEDDSLYDDRTIFDYINGAAEVYRAYTMQHCLSRRYTVPDGPAIMLDIFDMGSSFDAYGVFTYDQDGEKIALGQAALYRSGWLSMWKDRFFVSIYTEQETEASTAAIKEMAKTVSSLIEREGAKPPILSHLPSKGIQPRTTAFFYNHVVLNRHYYLAGENILNLDRQTSGALAFYRRENGSALLLLLKYQDGAKAKTAHGAFLGQYLPDADASGMALVEDKKWCGAAVTGKWLAVVLGSDNRKLAEALLQEVTTRVKETEG